jgi:hypothetical protein
LVDSLDRELFRRVVNQEPNQLYLCKNFRHQEARRKKNATPAYTKTRWSEPIIASCQSAKRARACARNERDESRSLRNRISVKRRSVSALSLMTFPVTLTDSGLPSFGPPLSIVMEEIDTPPPRCGEMLAQRPKRRGGYICSMPGGSRHSKPRASVYALPDAPAS